jgi:hypothetical protein
MGSNNRLLCFLIRIFIHQLFYETLISSGLKAIYDYYRLMLKNVLSPNKTSDLR